MKAVIEFVNNGEEFELPGLTEKDHERAMEMIATQHKKLTNLQFNREMNRKIVLITLQKVDKNVKSSEIETLHPDEFTQLLSAIWRCGRRDESKFRIGDDKPKNMDKEVGDKRNSVSDGRVDKKKKDEI